MNTLTNHGTLTINIPTSVDFNQTEVERAVNHAFLVPALCERKGDQYVVHFPANVGWHSLRTELVYDERLFSQLSIVSTALDYAPIRVSAFVEDTLTQSLLIEIQSIGNGDYISFPLINQEVVEL